LKDAAFNLNLLGEISDLIQEINSKSTEVDRLVNVKSRQAINSSAKKLLEVERYLINIEPKVDDINSRVNKDLSLTSFQPNLAKPLNTSRDELSGAIKDLSDKINSAKRSLVFQRRIFDFDEKTEDQQHDITTALAFVSAVDIGDDHEQIEKLKNRWQVFLTDLPQLVNRVDASLVEGQDLSNDLEILTNCRPSDLQPTRSKEEIFGLTIKEMATQPQSTYPFCNDESVKTGLDQVRAQIECLARDKGLLQEQVRLVQGRIDHTADISRFSTLGKVPLPLGLGTFVAH
uniref:Tektin n=1 Tax=Rodentolepis nana TaxID=102285 RepID=A0A0R3TG44_RODNA